MCCGVDHGSLTFTLWQIAGFILCNSQGDSPPIIIGGPKEDLVKSASGLSRVCKPLLQAWLSTLSPKNECACPSGECHAISVCLESPTGATTHDRLLQHVNIKLVISKEPIPAFFCTLTAAIAWGVLAPRPVPQPPLQFLVVGTESESTLSVLSNHTD